MRRRAQPWLGTLVEVTLADSLGEAEAAQAFNAAFAAIATVHRLMSFHDAASDVARINRLAPGGAIAVDAHTATVLRMALAMQAASGGLFDIACASRLVAWGLLPAASPPAAAHHGARLHLDAQGMVHKPAPLLIDLGGIAKGYAVDLAVEALRALHIASACVNAGGDLRVLGQTPYPVMIRDPRSPTRSGARIDLKDGALATSGSYFSQKMVDGCMRSALVDAGSGNALVDSRSATVQAPDCMTADALTKLVLLSADPQHPLLQQFGATAFII
ncbi:thiamine biosynthesis lipoprotein [Collimonas sp. PA-H2]|uniref:FAD:protein FMN transferase n=1 Tax=Collimonas sp. PA-H2 TaxID=1881062 RepID=UPI000BF6DB6E|nr:FAD:protein FMN transferase [Collimonas sp. PA-H2]PFH08634.1 thiamine biosynthesis lipoprotein [Collimonas sp. PA-H2]